MGGLAQAVV